MENVQHKGWVQRFQHSSTAIPLHFSSRLGPPWRLTKDLMDSVPEVRIQRLAGLAGVSQSWLLACGLWSVASCLENELEMSSATVSFEPCFPWSLHRWWCRCWWCWILDTISLSGGAFGSRRHTSHYCSCSCRWHLAFPVRVGEAVELCH